MTPERSVRSFTKHSDDRVTDRFRVGITVIQDLHRTALGLA
jgi:hypothetical protein